MSTRTKRKIAEAAYAAVMGVGVTAALLLCGTADAKAAQKADVVARQPQTEAPYRTAYGVVTEWGTHLETEDGNVWFVDDAPEYDDGTVVVVTFETMETRDRTDDKIVDIYAKGEGASF